jgi:hypothetical protein
MATILDILHYLGTAQMNVSGGKETKPAIVTNSSLSSERRDTADHIRAAVSGGTPATETAIAAWRIARQAAKIVESRSILQSLPHE